MLRDPGAEQRLMLCRAFCHPPYSVEAGGGRATAPVHLYTSLQHGISALVLTGAHNPFSVENKKKRSANWGEGMRATHRSLRVVFYLCVEVHL